MHLVWKAWSDPEMINQWWGKYLFDMETPDGKITLSTGIYEEIIPNKKNESQSLDKLQQVIELMSLALF